MRVTKQPQLGMGMQAGFTLLELMAVVMIIGILAAAALPSYNQYIVRNAEKEAQSQMGTLQTELERWRTTAMSYRGFYPLNGADANGKPIYAYADVGTNTKIYVPIGSNAKNYRYEITIGEINNGAFASLAPTPTTDFTLGRSWAMRATPNPNHKTVGKKGKTFVQTSSGFKCATTYGTPATTLKITETQCKQSGLEIWQ